MLGATVGIALELGYICAGWVSVGVSTWTGTNMSWRLPFIFQFIPLVPVLAGYPFIPESPRWLASQGRSAEALDVLTSLHASSKDVHNRFSRTEHRQIEAQSSWGSMFTTYRRRTLTAALVMFGYPLAGDYFLATYGPGLFSAFGYSTTKSLIFQAAWLTLLLINFIVMPLIDRVGRKVLIGRPSANIMVTGIQLLAVEPYFLFIFLTLANLILFVLYLPETKNVTLEEMAALFGEEDQVAVRKEDIHLED
ncbi:hypothetical protein RQP46_003654 [Phenoliferia psychrophenolica]